MSDHLDFSADVARLLDIVAHALYSNRDVFVRELIANAADACDRRRYEGIATPALLSPAPLRITLIPDPKARTLMVRDNGLGMTREDLVSHLGTIARSGTRAAMEQAAAQGQGKDALSLIGQFGVGFYSSFMVSSKVEVITRRAGADEVWHWVSDGRSGYEIAPASTEQAFLLGGDAGTAVICHLKDDASDYLLDAKLIEIVKTYADHITFPIHLGGEANGTPINQASALWTRPRSEITPAQYQEFFGSISGAFGTDAPVVTAHWKAEGKIEFTALLFVPGLRPWDLFDPARKPSVRLYVKRVFITEQAEGLMYPWLRFVRGVIDSEDLPLNISREMLQTNPIVTRIRTAVAGRILSDLKKLGENDPIAFAAFWGQFGAVLKEGLYDASEHRADLLSVCRFASSESGGDLITLDQYAARMKPGQEAIYYFSAESREAAARSPQLEGFKARGIEVLLMTDTIDDFWIPVVREHAGKAFVSITKGSVDLSAFPVLTGDAADEKAPDAPAPQADIDHLAALMAAALSGSVGAVRASQRLTSSPVCLVAGDNEVDMKMDKILKLQQAYDSHAQRILEINPAHPLIVHLAGHAKGMDTADDLIRETAFLLYDQARIIQGEAVADVPAFVRRMSDLMLKKAG